MADLDATSEPAGPPRVTREEVIANAITSPEFIYGRSERLWTQIHGCATSEPVKSITQCIF